MTVKKCHKNKEGKEINTLGPLCVPGTYLLTCLILKPTE